MKSALFLAIAITVALFTAATAQAACNDCIMQLIPLDNNVCQGDPIRFQIKLTNAFDRPKAITLGATSDIALSSDLIPQVIVGAYETRTLNVTFTPIADVIGKHGITVKATGYGTEDADDGLFVINDCYSPELELSEQEVYMCESSEGSIDFTITNNGLRDDDYTISVAGMPAGVLGVSFTEGRMSLAPGESQTESLTIEPLSNEYGQYTLQLTVMSGRKSVYEQFAVNLEDCYYSSVYAPEEFITCPDEGLSYDVSVSNEGSAEDNYTIELDGSCHARAEPDAFSLGPGETETVEILLDDREGECDLVVSAAGAYSSDSAATHVEVKKCYGLSVELLPEEAESCPGEPVSYNIAITNEGYYPDEYTLTLEGADIDLAESVVHLDSGEQATQTFEVLGPWCITGDIPLSLTAVATAGREFVLKRGMLRVMEPGGQCAALELSPGQNPLPLDCDGGSYTFYIKNTGYAEQDVKLSLSAPQAPDLIMQPKSLALVPREVRPIALYLIPPEGKGNASFSMTVIAESEYKKAYLMLDIDFDGPICGVSSPVLETPLNDTPSATNGSGGVGGGNRPNATQNGTQTPSGAVLGGSGLPLFIIGALTVSALAMLAAMVVMSRRGRKDYWHFPEVKNAGQRAGQSNDERLAAIREAISKSSK